MTRTEPSVLAVVQHQSPSDKEEPLWEKLFPFVQQALGKSHVQHCRSRTVPAAVWVRTAAVAAGGAPGGLVPGCQRCCKAHISEATSQAKAIK